MIDSVLRIFVPPHARNKYRPKYYSSQRQDKEDKDSDIMKRADEAWLTVERTKKAVGTAGSAADEVRAYADEARRSYEECLRW